MLQKYVCVNALCISCSKQNLCLLFIFRALFTQKMRERCGKPLQGQLLEGVECHIYLYCFTFDDINLNRAFVIIVLFPKKYRNKKVCANDIRKRNASGIY